MKEESHHNFKLCCYHLDFEERLLLLWQSEIKALNHYECVLFLFLMFFFLFFFFFFIFFFLFFFFFFLFLLLCCYHLDFEDLLLLLWQSEIQALTQNELVLLLLLSFFFLLLCCYHLDFEERLLLLWQSEI